MARLVPGTALAFAAVLALLSTPALAGTGSLGIHGSRLDEIGGATTSYVGGHLELRLNPILGISAALDYREETSGPVGEPVVLRDVPLTVSGRLHLPRILGVELFGTAGGGWYHRITEIAGDRTRSTSTRFGWHVGGGVDVLVAPHLSITAEHRRLVLGKSGFPPLRGIEDREPDGTYGSLGLSLHF